MTDVLKNPQTATRSRGAESRERQIVVAAELFASRGFNGVSVRDVAAAADVNVAAISYHFGGKQGLYQAALERLMEEMAPVGRPVIEHINGLFEDGPPDKLVLRESMEFVVRHILSTMLSGDLPQWVTQTVLREFQQPTPDYRPMLDERVLPLHQAIRRLVAAALDIDSTTPNAILSSHAVMGQIMVFAATRGVILEELAWNDFSDGRLEQVIEAASAGVLRAIGLQIEQEAV
jgi:AcrR family transcriptional regulator